MNMFPLLREVLGVTSASACGAALTALLFAAPIYLEEEDRAWVPLMALEGAAAGCVLGALIGLVAVLSGAGAAAAALVGAVGILPAAALLYMGSIESSYKLAGLLLIPSGALAGVIASRAPFWAGDVPPLPTAILILLTGSPMIALAAAAGVYLAKGYAARIAMQRHQEVVARLDAANVEVTAKEARVIVDTGYQVLAEVTLAIRNVPPSIQCYEMNIHEVGSGGAFSTGDFMLMRTNVGDPTQPPTPVPYEGGPTQDIPSPYLKVTNTGRGWEFYDTRTGRVLSDDHENVTLQFGLMRTRAARGALPDTISPRLGIWAREDNVYSQDYRFFYKPIPVSFVTGPNPPRQGR